MGGSTGLVGDPKATGERVMNTKETVATWVERIRDQVSRFVDLDGDNAATMVNNLDWTESLGTLDFLRDIGKHFPVNRMLARDVVSSRLESGISYTEFSYVLLQSLDYLELHRRYGCVLQTGGSDQWGNITAGVELVRRADGMRVHALATPLVEKADGTKFGKTESGTVWLDAELMSPYAFYQSWIQAEDAKVGEYLKQFTFLAVDEIDALMAEHLEAPGRRVAQRRLAAEVTTLVHGAAEVEAAELASGALFGRGDLADLPEPTLAAALREAGAVDLVEGRPSDTHRCLGGHPAGRQPVGRTPRGRRRRRLPQQRAGRRPRSRPRHRRPPARLLGRPEARKTLCFRGPSDVSPPRGQSRERGDLTEAMRTT